MSSRSPLGHMAQLDALRAFAVGGVLLQHYWPPTYALAETGAMGVHLFFVLSGFLITGILLQARAAVDAGEESAGFSLRRFYIRRVLRIFPLYYAVLLVAWLTRVPGARGAFGWHLAYLTNVHHFVAETYGERMGPYWSLAVEEQFYLVWPLLVLFAPYRWLPAIALGAIAVSPVFRFVVTALTGNELTVVLPFSCLDSLGLGAYLAMGAAPAFAGHALVRRIGGGAALAGLGLLAAHQVAVWTGTAPILRVAIFGLAVALPSAWIIRHAAAGFRGWPGRILELGPLRWIGTISYGIYVYHLLLPYLFPKIAAALGYRGFFDPLGHGLERTVWYPIFYSAATVVVAALSWYCFEGPINRLKERFAYRHAAGRHHTPARQPVGAPD
jgi:peptidoglycan/LPS O-acetylase OafA/YrhL